MFRLFIYIPCYNAAATLPELLRRLKGQLPALRSMGVELERLVIVNDGSHDDTARILRKARLPGLRIIEKAENEGATAAVLGGMQEVLRETRVRNENEKNGKKKDVIVVRMDSDLEHQPEDLPRLLRPLIEDRCRMVVGVNPEDPHHSPIVRWFNRWAGESASRRFLEQRIPQFCPGFQAMDGALFERLAPALLREALAFRTRNKKDMVTIDFVALVLARRLGAEPLAVGLSPTELRWFKPMKLSKLSGYLQHHWRTMDWLREREAGAMGGCGTQIREPALRTRNGKKTGRG